MSDATERAITLILAGGAGSRLHPLTAERAKPAVPFGGKYRIIDFTLSNCLHSKLRRVLVLTQYKSHSLQKHLRDGWSIFNPSVGEYITPIPPQMRTGKSWYVGTADAVFQNLYLLERSGAEEVVVLSGDHIYRMDYAAMLEAHRDVGADATLACMRVRLDEASGFGVLSTGDAGWITGFEEKPAHPVPLPADPGHALASMGVYIFRLDLLRMVLHRDHERPGSSHDFGRDIVPRLIRSNRVHAYRFGAGSGRVTTDRYWRDVGTIDAYYAANMDLLAPVPAIDLYQEDWPIRTFENQSPPARTVRGETGRDASLVNSIVASGAIVSGGSARNSILSSNVRVEDRASVEQAILFDGVTVGAGARVRNCIVDKRVRIPPGESIGVDASRDRERFPCSEGGIAVVPKGYRFPGDSGTRRAAADDTATAAADSSEGSPSSPRSSSLGPSG